MRVVRHNAPVTSPVEPVDIVELVERISFPDTVAGSAAKALTNRIDGSLDGLGRLEPVSSWLCSVQGTCPPRPLERIRVVVFAADHGVADTSLDNPSTTAQQVLDIIAGRSLVNELAHHVGATVRVVDIGVDVDWAVRGVTLPEEVSRHWVRRGHGSTDREDAMTRDEADIAFAHGLRLAEEEVDAGADLLIPCNIGVGSATAAATVIALYVGLDAPSAVGMGTGIDDATWMRTTAEVRDAMRRGRPLKGYTLGMLAAVGGSDIIAMAGFLLGAAARRTPVLLDGVVSYAAALVAQRVAYRSRGWWLAGHLPAEPAAAKALERLDMTPAVDFGLSAGPGVGTLIAVPVLSAVGAILRYDQNSTVLPTS